MVTEASPDRKSHQRGWQELAALTDGEAFIRVKQEAGEL